MTVAERNRRLQAVLVLSALSAAVLAVAAPSTHPSVTTWAGVERWYETVGPAPAAVGVVWLAALVVAAWLVVACLLQLIAGQARGGWLRSLADHVAPVALRGFVAASVTAALALGSPTGAGAGDAPGIATLHPLGAEEVPATSSTVVTSPAVTPADAATATPVPGTPVEAYTIRPGDSFWSVARRRLADAAPGAAPPSHHDYWRRLIAANLDRLVDPGNPDLLYPGQVLVLPPLT